MASAYTVLSLFPGIPMIGADGSTIDFVRILEIGYGLALGPIYGPIAAFMGAVIGKILKGGGLGLFFTPLAAVSTFMAAMIGRENGKYWWVAAGLEAVLIGGWYIFDVGRIIWYFPVMHVFSVLVLLVLRTRISKWINSDNKREMSLGVLVCSFVSTTAGHMLGNLIYVILLAPDPILFNAIMFIAFIERVGISIGATLFAVSLLMAMQKIYPELLE
jgi:hypothetical protein